MKNFKVFKAAVVLFALLFAVTGVAYADNNTSKFTDIDSNWAEQHIINVCSKGLMGGVTATQFKPGDYIKNYDALVSISRMVNRENDINLEQLERKYQVSVIEMFNVPDYARKDILMCLDKGIISDFDVSAFAKTPNATKKDIAKYLGLAFGVKVNKDAPPVVLAFKDSMYIPTMYKPYVEFLIKNGVVNASGDVNGKFNPDSFIDRAAFAKMLDISNSVYEKEKLGLDTTTTDTTPSDIDTGSEVIWTAPTVSTPPAIVDDGAKADVTAIVDEVIAEYGNLAVFVGTERRAYKVADNAVCTIDEVSSGYWKLKKSDVVKLYIQNEKVVKIVGESKIRKTVGKLASIQSGDKTTLLIETLTGGTKSYIITAKTIVIKDGKSALWQELKNGNDLVITTSYDELMEINADGIKSTDKGVIESVVYSRMAPPKVVITALDGSQNAYYSNKSIEIIGADSDVYSLRPGMQVEVSLLDDEISKIEVINETASVLVELK
ncbi:MAG TPA: S-layer homology domain-containing protein, partial [Candidatus Nitrosocosmicus sp.]|nr:S-layer homology domain-containing protein [Candidatus Nitrosocosmicus sp.]